MWIEPYLIKSDVLNMYDESSKYVYVIHYQICMKNPPDN